VVELVSSIFGVLVAIIVAAVGVLTALGFLLKRRASSLAPVPVAMGRIPVEGSVSHPEEDEPEAVEEVRAPADVARPPKKRSGKKSRKPKTITKSLEAKIISMYRKGKSPKEIAEALGISRSTVYRRIRKDLNGGKAKN